MVEVGDKAPDFTLADENGDEHTLSDHLGKGPVVISVHFFAFTGVCTTQQGGLSRALGDLQSHGVTVFGLSTDSPFALRAWKERETIEFPLLSDYNKKVLPAFGALYDFKDMQGVAKRSVFVVDKDGVVRYKWMTSGPPAESPDIPAVVAEAKKLA